VTVIELQVFFQTPLKAAGKGI